MDQMQDIQRKMEQANSISNRGGLIVFGHFPSAMIQSPVLGIRDIIAEAKPNAYLNGHMHDL